MRALPRHRDILTRRSFDIPRDWRVSFDISGRVFRASTALRHVASRSSRRRGNYFIVERVDVEYRDSRRFPSLEVSVCQQFYPYQRYKLFMLGNVPIIALPRGTDNSSSEERGMTDTVFKSNDSVYPRFLFSLVLFPARATRLT